MRQLILTTGQSMAKKVEYRTALEKLSMANYLLSYDLIGRKDYQPLFDELKRLKAVRVLLCTWYLENPELGDIELVRDHFRRFVEQDDRLFVATVAGWAAHNARSLPPAGEPPAFVPKHPG